MILIDKFLHWNQPDGKWKLLTREKAFEMMKIYTIKLKIANDYESRMMKRANVIADSEFEMYRLLDEVYQETKIELWNLQHTIQKLELDQDDEFKQLLNDCKLKPKLICTGFGILKQSRK